jgi:hypothetical protein
MKEASRSEIDAGALIGDFLTHTEEEDPKLHKHLVALSEEAQVSLAGVIGRFDYSGNNKLTATQRLFAGRVLGRLRKPDAEQLAVLNRVLDYLDFDQSSFLSEAEMETCVEILELFAHVESDNQTLSERELKMLYAVLRHLDHDDTGRLEERERHELRRGLKEPRIFWAKQKEENPLLEELL